MTENLLFYILGNKFFTFNAKFYDSLTVLAVETDLKNQAWFRLR